MANIAMLSNMAMFVKGAVDFHHGKCIRTSLQFADVFFSFQFPGG